MDKPLVVVRILTFNHAKYIRQCLDSVLGQRTDFAFHVVIGDDCSTDGTTEICKEYVNRYPGRITLLVNEVNNISLNSKRNFEECKRIGPEYIALIEGDDFWTDPGKLQKQVDFLEKNREFQFSGHLTHITDEGGNITGLFNNVSGVITIADAVLRKEPHTSSFLFRNRLKTDLLIGDIPAADIFILCGSLKNGPGYIFNEAMSCYRMHHAGVYSPTDENRKIIVTVRLQLFLFRNFMHNWYKQAAFIAGYCDILKKRAVSIGDKLSLKEKLTLFIALSYFRFQTAAKELYFKLPVLKYSSLGRLFRKQK